MTTLSRSSIVCGIVLAAGDGTRLQPLVRRLRGDALPKQYVDFTGQGSMLAHTFRRAETLIQRRRLFSVVSRSHFAYPEVWRELAERPGGRVVVQPANRETGPGLLLPLAHASRWYPDAIVVVFPSDHDLADDGIFMAHVDTACGLVERAPERMVVLGVEPTVPDSDYGYLLLGDADERLDTGGCYPVSAFIEKPDPSRAEALIRRGALWNTFVMVFRAAMMWDFVREASPALFGAFRRIQVAVGTREERAVTEDVYRRLDAVNFSRTLLPSLAAGSRSTLVVLPVRGVRWSDCGVEPRLLTMLQHSERDAQPLCA
jgi:mannose-1-phosphate guanylyltransferase